MTHPAAFDPAHVADGTALPAYKPAAEPDDDQPNLSARDELYAVLRLAGENRAEVDRLLAAYRDQVLTEAAETAGTVIGPLWHLDTLHEICDRLHAARSITAQEN
jgi:hypothetical protein